MPDFRVIIQANMRSLIGYLGCLDAVAETINARWGAGTSKGTVSKKSAGALDWTLMDMIALEDAAGRYPITRMLMRRLDQQPVVQGGEPVAGWVQHRERKW